MELEPIGYGYDDDMGRHILSEFGIEFIAPDRKVVINPVLLQWAALGPAPNNHVVVDVQAECDGFAGKQSVSGPLTMLYKFCRDLLAWPPSSTVEFPSPETLILVESNVHVLLAPYMERALLDVTLGSPYFSPSPFGDAESKVPGFGGAAVLRCSFVCETETIARAQAKSKSLVLWLERLK